MLTLLNLGKWRRSNRGQCDRPSGQVNRNGLGQGFRSRRRRRHPFGCSHEHHPTAPTQRGSSTIVPGEVKPATICLFALQGIPHRLQGQTIKSSPRTGQRPTRDHQTPALSLHGTARQFWTSPYNSQGKCGPFCEKPYHNLFDHASPP